MSENFSVCDTPGCPNRRRVANHPRSERDPERCGMCDSRVRMIKAKHRKEEGDILES